MDSAEIKRQILIQAEKTGIRDRLIQQYEGGIGAQDILDMGAAFENMTQTKGWTYIESYIIGHANPVAMLFSQEDNPLEKGKAQGLISLMQYVEQVITTKNAILEAENQKRKQAEDGKRQDSAATEDI